MDDFYLIFYDNLLFYYLSIMSFMFYVFMIDVYYYNYLNFKYLTIII